MQTLDEDTLDYDAVIEQFTKLNFLLESEPVACSCLYTDLVNLIWIRIRHIGVHENLFCFIFHSSPNRIAENNHFGQ